MASELAASRPQANRDLGRAIASAFLSSNRLALVSRLRRPDFRLKRINSSLSFDDGLVERGLCEFALSVETLRIIAMSSSMASQTTAPFMCAPAERPKI